MLSTDEIQLLRTSTILDDNNVINFVTLKKMGLVILHTHRMVWLQPHDKEIIPHGIEIVLNPEFFQHNLHLRLANPFQQSFNTTYIR